MSRTGPSDRQPGPFDEIEAEAAEVLPALVASLPEERPPASAWERIAAAVAAEPRRPAATQSPSAPGKAAGTAAALERPGPPRAPGAAQGWQRWRMRPPVALVTARRVAAVSLLAVVAALGAFAALQAASVGSLTSEQRVLAVWMSDPDMHLVALRAPASGVPAALAQVPDGWDDEDYDPSLRLGVVCVLPDGRALVFQPERAPRGTTYVVLGQGPAGEVELARGRGNLLRFQAVDITSLRVRLLTRSGESLPVAWAVLN